MAIGDLADAVRRVPGGGQAGDRLCEPAIPTTVISSPRPRPKYGSTRSARCDRRARRLEPLFQGAARQARGDRQRLSRRHLQGGGRTLHAQRHVAGSARELRRARPGAARNLARRTSSRRGRKRMSTVPQGHDRARSRRPAATWPRRRSTARLVDKHRRPPRIRGAPGRVRRRGRTRPGATAQIKLAVLRRRQGRRRTRTGRSAW